MTAPATLDRIHDFPGLVRYLRDELEWEIPDDAAFGDLTFNWTPSEIGLDLNEPIEITQLRPLRADQRWGVFFLNFPHGKLPVTLMRRILRGLSKRKRASANAADKAAWDKDDLIFISAVGDADDRRLSFAHFQDRGNDLPTLRVIGWDKDDTVRRLSHTDHVLRSKLGWLHGEGLPLDWRDAFTERPRESVRTAKEMAEALAALARDIRDRIKLILPREKANGDLKQLFEAVKQTLSRDLDNEKFADTYAQTIAYGLLSARINQVRERDERHQAAQKTGLGPKPALPAITADAAGQAMPTTNPFLKELFGSFLSAGGRDAGGAGLDFDELGVGEVVDLLNAADMEAVLLDFDKHKTGDDPVIHFYEGFLHAYDKALKVQRGVFYTPRSVVSFIVRSADEVLRTEFGLADGLADVTTWAEFAAAHPEVKIPSGVRGNEPFVQILDPATGTGTFLVEVIDLIFATMMTKWKAAGLDAKARDEAWNAYVPQHLLPRLHGFELMMAPYAIAHMKLGLKLADTGYRFEGNGTDGKPARARVFLTNALEQARDLTMELSFMSEALAHEAKAANDAKRTSRFTVILGNPPYAGHSSNNNVKWIVDGVIEYRKRFPDLMKPGQGKWLQDDYVKFFRLSQHFVMESGLGILGFVTNHSWLDNPTYKGMRASLFGDFERIFVIDLHGNINKKEVAPDGSVDENVFRDIAQGVAIAICIRHKPGTVSVRRGDIFGREEEKLKWLTDNDTAGAPFSDCDVSREPFSFTLGQTRSPDYEGFPSISQVMGENGDPAPGMVTTHDEFAISFTNNEQQKKVEALIATADEDEARRLYTLCSQSQWNYDKAKTALRNGSWKSEIAPVLYRPFDVRWTVYNSHVAVHRRARVSDHLVAAGNVGIITTRQTKDRWGVISTQTIAGHKSLGAYDINYVFPLWIRSTIGLGAQPNLSPSTLARVAELTNLTFDDGSSSTAERLSSLPQERGDLINNFGARDLFDWIYAVLYSPSYRQRYADFLKADFARVPLPRDRALFAELIPLGTELALLHMLDATQPILAEPSVRFVNPDNVEARLDSRKADARRNPAGRVYVNDACWFETVPASVWGQWIGGYQPAQKWLKDRAAKGGKNKSEGRILTPEDQLHYRRMITALGRTAELMVEIDAVVARHGGWPDAFRGMTD